MNEGKVDITDMENSKDPAVRDEARRMLEDDRARKSRMSPAGALGLPELLEKRRLEYGIPDGFFKQTPLFDRILVFQIEIVGGEKYEGSSLIRPESVRAREREEACRGIIVAAGLLALDQLRSNGADLGHVVTFIRQAPWRIPMDYVSGKPIYALGLSAGDVWTSLDLNDELQGGRLEITREVVSGGVVLEHYYSMAGPTPERPISCGKPLPAYQNGGY